MMLPSKLAQSGLEMRNSCNNLKTVTGRHDADAHELGWPSWGKL